VRDLSWVLASGGEPKRRRESVDFVIEESDRAYLNVRITFERRGYEAGRDGAYSFQHQHPKTVGNEYDGTIRM
jgi:hypothetical protein